MNNALNYFTSSFHSDTRKNSKGKKAVFGSTIGIAGIGAGIIGKKTYQWIKNSPDIRIKRLRLGLFSFDPNADLFKSIDKKIEYYRNILKNNNSLDYRTEFDIKQQIKGLMQDKEYYSSKLNDEDLKRIYNNYKNFPERRNRFISDSYDPTYVRTVDNPSSVHTEDDPLSFQTVDGKNMTHTSFTNVDLGDTDQMLITDLFHT